MMFSIKMFLLFVAVCLTTVTSDCPGSSLSPRTLVSPAPAHEPTPWHAIIYEQTQDSLVALCGGTLVSPSHVVTAANCFWSAGNRTSINPALFEVAVGKHCERYEDLEQDAQVMTIKSVTLHPWFSGSESRRQHDIAVVELKKPANLTSTVVPALIERVPPVGGEHLPAGTTGLVAAWLGDEARSLSSVQLPYFNFRACADLVHARHGLVPSTDKFCAGAKDDTRTLCRQDFGAGYIYKHPSTNESFLRGVLSTDLMPTQFTSTCHQNDVAGFTNLADPLTLDWLTQVIPAPAVPCPAVLKSHSVSFVYCNLLGVTVDCSLPMPTGSTSVSACNTGYHIDSNRNSKTSTCSSDGTWTDSHLTCVQVRPGYQQITGQTNQYQHHAIAVTWPEAKALCEAEQAHLVILNSEAEYAAMQNLIQKNFHKEVGATGNPGSTWVGLRESSTKQNEYFTMLGQPLSATGFTRWHPGFPASSALGDAVYIHHSGVGLADLPATYGKLPYICELEV